jgi:hypothetical protein
MKIFEFFQDDNGIYSSTRLAFLLWVIGVLVVWCIKSIQCPGLELANIPGSILTILGILASGKVIQKNFETKLGNNTISTPNHNNTSR